MDWQLKCAAVIPCLDEAATIGGLVQAVRPMLPRVLVVDDGSSDGTGLVAQKAGAEVLRNELTLGKGAALTRGWQHARESGFTWALTLDGDGQHSPEDIPSFFRCAERTSAALVVGDRMAEAVRIPPLRRLTNRWMSRQLSELSGKPLPDTQCGFRLVNLEAWSKLPITSRHFEIESEVLISYLAAGLEVEFVPIRVIYKNEQSKIHPLRDALRWFQWWRHMRHSFAKRDQ
jgi:glycosyltransferase involved in cell wall biosynthesis